MTCALILSLLFASQSKCFIFQTQHGGYLPKSFMKRILTKRGASLVGKSKSEIEKEFGNPTAVDEYNGQTRWFYEHQEYRPGMFKKYHTIKSWWLTIVFDSDDIVVAERYGKWNRAGIS